MPSELTKPPQLPLGLETPPRARTERQHKEPANLLTGKEWTRNSISVWGDIRKTREELQLSKRHPAIFPEMLVRRAMDCYMRPSDKVVLDPFSGVGSTVVAAHRSGRVGIGLEVYEEYISDGESRLRQQQLGDSEDEDACRMIRADARHARRYLKDNSVDFVFTSPPYWDILTQRRTADNRPSRAYGVGDPDVGDLGLVSNYDDFIQAVGGVFLELAALLRSDHYCVINVMDIRKKDVFFPLHSDLARVITQRSDFTWDDLIVWDRRHEYNNYRPLGHPYRFVVNKAHEYLLVFRNRKPQ